MIYRSLTSALIFSIALLASPACLPAPPDSASDGRTITVYGFSIMRETLEKDIYPAFAAKWKREHGDEVNFVSSFAGSETVTNQILQGAPADLAILSIERDADRLVAAGAASTGWKSEPNGGIVNKTPFVIIVRAGNPRNIHDFVDLGRPGVSVIHPSPASSGGAQWSILAIYGSELKRTEAETGGTDPAAATNTLKAIWKNVISSPGSAREARTQFELGQGDALVTYELEALQMKQAGEPIEVVIPRSTIFSEHPALIIDRNVNAAKRPLVEAFLHYLWSDEAQTAFVKNQLRAVTRDDLNSANPGFASIERPFGVDYFGGWAHAYPDVIEGVFLKQVQVK